MAVPLPLYLSQFTFNSVTYSKTSGGPLDLIINENVQNVSDRTGDAKYPMAVALTDVDPIVFIKMRDTSLNVAKGTSGNLVATVKKGDGTTKVATMTNMVYAGLDTNQVRANPGEIVLKFIHESSDGTSNWISWA